ncbi:hypothetical protein K9L16_02985 [Candidatus Pacearchaeota archaeon]|nr:hypothetical protein [Candidatus Pacearchaeota archaeon]
MEIEVIDSNYDPVYPFEVEAWDLWGRREIWECYKIKLEKFGEEFLDEMNSWDCYETFCQDCESHNKCFRNSDWFKGYVNGD